jgi:hypothetical protein
MTRRERERERERRRNRLTWIAITTISIACLVTSPASSQTVALQRISLSFEDTATLGDLLFGQGVVEVTTASTGATTAGGTVTWAQYMEQSDHLGMWHVYYRQQYHHPQLDRQLPVVGSAVSLHYAPDGALRWVNGAQLSDVAPLPEVTVATAQNAFDAMQRGLAHRPGFPIGDPGSWPPGLLSRLLERSELRLATPPGPGGHRLEWRLTTVDAGLAPWRVLLDATTGELLSVAPSGDPSGPLDFIGCWGMGAECPSCDSDGAHNVDAKAQPENPGLTCPSYSCDADGYRPVKANALAEVASCVGDNNLSDCVYYRYKNNAQTSCDGACTHEAARAADNGIPAIEVYQGMSVESPVEQKYNLHCGSPERGYYMRLGLKEVEQHPFYGSYAGSKKLPTTGYTPHARLRSFAGDAMFHTYKTFEVLRDELGWCGLANDCGNPGVARVVVDQRDHIRDKCGAPFFNPPDATEFYAPTEGIVVYQPCPALVPPLPGPDRSPTAALDSIAHEWGHGVDYHGSAMFAARCDLEHSDTFQVCQIKEGFADVIGHIVERYVHTTQGVGEDGTNFAEHQEQWDWVAGEDYDTSSEGWFRRRADRYDADHSCLANNWHVSVHTDDEACEVGTPSLMHNAGNRLAVVLRLLAEGDANPGCSQVGNCNLVVQGVGMPAASKILFRLLTVEADTSTDEWGELVRPALEAAFDEYHGTHPPCALDIQHSVYTAFNAVGYYPPPPYPAGGPYLCNEEQ